MKAEVVMSTSPPLPPPVVVQGARKLLWRVSSSQFDSFGFALVYGQYEPLHVSGQGVDGILRVIGVYRVHDNDVGVHYDFHERVFRRDNLRKLSCQD